MPLALKQTKMQDSSTFEDAFEPLILQPKSQLKMQTEIGKSNYVHKLFAKISKR